MFPGQTTVWNLTAAQRALMLGPDKEPVKRLSMAEMKERTARTLEKAQKDNGTSSP